QFREVAELAIPHFEVFSHNITIIYSFSYTEHESLLYSTFTGIAQSFETSWDLDAALQEYSSDLEVISNHLAAIGEVWKNAGEAISDILEMKQGLLGEHFILLIGAAGILVVCILVPSLKLRGGG
ncbi:MAG: hypothetical protein ACFE7R_04090, partial [Candidatus Hodarchaeota archaeon]